MLKPKLIFLVLLVIIFQFPISNVYPQFRYYKRLPNQPPEQKDNRTQFYINNADFQVIYKNGYFYYGTSWFNLTNFENAVLKNLKQESREIVLINMPRISFEDKQNLEGVLKNIESLFKKYGFHRIIFLTEVGNSSKLTILKE